MAGCGESSVSPSAKRNIILDLSFPQGCSESEEFIHANFTSGEDNGLERKPIY